VVEDASQGERLEVVFRTRNDVEAGKHDWVTMLLQGVDVPSVVRQCWNVRYGNQVWGWFMLQLLELG
jgi:hypothetical protein